MPGVSSGKGMALAGVMVLLGGMPGCVSGPSLHEASDGLEQDTQAVLGNGARRLGPPGTNPMMISDTTQPCEDGKARRIMRGRVSLRSAADPGVTLDQATDVAISMIRERGYRLDGPPQASNRRRRVFVMIQDAPGGKVTVRLRGGRKSSSMEIEATTACLSP